ITLSGTSSVERSAVPRIVLTIPSACCSILFTLSMISDDVVRFLILRTSAMISNTANGLPPAVSAKPLSDGRDERFMVVLLHDPPGVIAQMPGVSALFDPACSVVVPLRPTTPQVQSIVRTPPLAPARSRRQIQGDLFLILLLETWMSELVLFRLSRPMV